MPILSKRSGQDERAALFPPELLAHFDGAMIASFDLYEEYVSRLALVLFRTIGLEAACRSAASATEAVARAGLVTHAARVPASWILALLASRDWIARESGVDGQIRYRLGQALPFLDPEELRAAQQAHDPRCLPAYDIAALAAAHYPDVLSGRINGEQALFGEAGVIPWVKYFSNDNPMDAISNTVGAIPAAQSAAADTGAVLLRMRRCIWNWCSTCWARSAMRCWCRTGARTAASSPRSNGLRRWKPTAFRTCGCIPTSGRFATPIRAA